MIVSAPWCRIRHRVARMLAVARIEFLHLIRDRTTIALVVTIPAIQLVLFGYAVNLNPKAIPLAIARNHGGPADQLHRTIEETGYFSILADRLEPGAAERLVVEGKALVGIELPPLDDSDPEAPSAEPRIVVDATDPAAVRPALAALETAYWRHVAQTSPLVLTPSVDIEWLYNPEGRTTWAIVPGLAGVVVMISMLLLGALTLVRERERGSWETLLATPVDAVDALVGKLSPYVIIGTLQAAVMTGVARVLFDLPVTGNLWALLLAVPVYAAAHLILGFAFSALAESQLQAIQGAVFFYLPSMLLSGFMFPFQGMPAWARTIGEALPLTHFVRATRGVLLRGEGVSLVISEMAPVALFALLAATVALAAYRRRLD
jgi:ABC-2 type transport system permease protein